MYKTDSRQSARVIASSIGVLIALRMDNIISSLCSFKQTANTAVPQRMPFRVPSPEGKLEAYSTTCEMLTSMQQICRFFALICRFFALDAGHFAIRDGGHVREGTGALLVISCVTSATRSRGRRKGNRPPISTLPSNPG